MTPAGNPVGACQYLRRDKENNSWPIDGRLLSKGEMMNARRNNDWRRAARRLLASTVLAAGVLAGTSVPANAATTATFSSGVLTVFGDGANNSIAISRDAAGKILVNNGAVAVVGGSPTVANTVLIRVFGLDGHDVITLNEANGALPAANLFGGSGNDTLTGGSGADQLFGQAGNDTHLGRGGNDLLFGGSENDTMTGGDGDDQVFGQGGSDRMTWNPGDDTDLNEGGDGVDTAEVNGGNGAEQFTATANGSRVRFDRVSPAPFAIDIGTSEKLVVNANGGDDSFAATGNLAALIAITVDDSAGNDTLRGGNGADVLLGGDGNDFVDGNQGNDVALLGAGDDSFQWDPGDGSDVVEGQDGIDAMAFNGSNVNENMNVSANGQRVRFFRDIGNITMDLNDVEFIVAKTFGGSDKLVVNDLSGTDVINVVADLAAIGGDDGQPDNVVVNATDGDDVATVTGAGPNVRVSGLPALVSVSGAIAGSDRLTVNSLAGADVVDASGLSANSALLTVDGGDGDDVLLGGDGDDVLLGGAGDDVLIGGPGTDTIDGGPGDNVVLDGFGANTVTSAAAAGKDWLTTHARTVDGKTVLDVGGKERTLPRADLVQLARDVTSS
jgi:Ca2+-binding RTX toxin-like protein